MLYCRTTLHATVSSLLYLCLFVSTVSAIDRAKCAADIAEKLNNGSLQPYSDVFYRDGQKIMSEPDNLVLTLEGCRSQCGTGFSFSSHFDTGSNWHTWLLPVLLILGNIQILLVRFFGNPIDLVWSSLFKQTMQTHRYPVVVQFATDYGEEAVIEHAKLFSAKGEPEKGKADVTAEREAIMVVSSPSGNTSEQVCNETKNKTASGRVTRLRRASHDTLLGWVQLERILKAGNKTSLHQPSEIPYLEEEPLYLSWPLSSYDVQVTAYCMAGLTGLLWGAPTVAIRLLPFIYLVTGVLAGVLWHSRVSAGNDRVGLARDIILVLFFTTEVCVISSGLYINCQSWSTSHGSGSSASIPLTPEEEHWFRKFMSRAVLLLIAPGILLASPILVNINARYINLWRYMFRDMWSQLYNFSWQNVLNLEFNRSHIPPGKVRMQWSCVSLIANAFCDRPSLPYS